MLSVKQVPMRPSKIIHITWSSQTSHSIRDAGPVGNLLASYVFWFIQCLEHSSQTTWACQINCIWLRSPILKYLSCMRFIVFRKLLRIESKDSGFNHLKRLMSWKRDLQAARCCISRRGVTSRAVLFCLTSLKDSTESWGDELCLKGVCILLSFPPSIHSFR